MIIPVSLPEGGFTFRFACAICGKPIEDLQDASIEWDDDACREPITTHNPCTYSLNRSVPGRQSWWRYPLSHIPRGYGYKKQKSGANRKARK